MKNHDPIGQQLKHAARAAIPPFSEDLHRRVMTEVRRDAAQRSAAATPPPHLGWIWRVGAAAALVAILVGVGTVLLQPSRTTPPTFVTTNPPNPDIAPLSIPSLDQVAAETEAVREKLKEARYAYLDRDAKRLTRFLWRSVPGVPAPDRSHKDTDG